MMLIYLCVGINLTQDQISVWKIIYFQVNMYWTKTSHKAYDMLKCSANFQVYLVKMKKQIWLKQNVIN